MSPARTPDGQVDVFNIRTLEGDSCHSLQAQHACFSIFQPPENGRMQILCGANYSTKQQEVLINALVSTWDFLPRRWPYCTFRDPPPSTIHSRSLRLLHHIHLMCQVIEAFFPGVFYRVLCPTQLMKSILLLPRAVTNFKFIWGTLWPSSLVSSVECAMKQPESVEKKLINRCPAYQAVLISHNPIITHYSFLGLVFLSIGHSLLIDIISLDFAVLNEAKHLWRCSGCSSVNGKVGSLPNICSFW